MNDRTQGPNERGRQMQSLIAAYLEAAGNGQAPPREEWLARHPDLADDLRRFLENHHWMQRLGEPLRQEDASASPVTEAGATNATAPLVPLGVVRYFGDYELLQEIARGGMGVVYKARQVSLNRVVALKMILAGQLASERDLQRFRAEAEAVANLDHPNIVPIYETGAHEGQQYFSMKFVEGGSLVGAMPDLHRDHRRAATLIGQVARAVHFAHQRGILHRDIKPANILLDRDGSPFVTDFGLARRVEGEAGSLPSGAIVGTPAYMPPEQARGEKQLTTAADVWSLGVMVYECLAGRPPFQADNVMDTLIQVIDREPEHPRSLNPRADADLCVIALKCLRKEPARRYESAAVLADDLQRFLDGEPILARPTGSAERAFKWVRRNPVVAALTAAVATSLVLGACLATVLAALANHNAEIARSETRRANAKADEAGREALRADGEAKRAKEAAARARKEADRADGEAKKAQQSAADAKKLLGWIVKAHRGSWSIREGFEWYIPNTLPKANPRRMEPAKIFRSETDAKEALTGNAVSPLFMEILDPKKGSNRVRSDAFRFPILGASNMSNENVLYCVGVRSGVVNKVADKLRPDGGAFATRLSPQMKRILKDQGVDIDKLWNLPGVELLDVGYIWEKNARGQQQIGRRLFLSETEITLVVKELNRLLAIDPNEGRLLVEVIDRNITKYMGDNDAKKRLQLSLQDLFRRQLTGVEFHSSLLTKTLGQLQKNEDADNLKARQALQLKLMKLEDLVAKPSKVHQYTSRMGKIGGRPVTVWGREGKPVLLDGTREDRGQRGFFRHGDRSVTYYWVDYEEEWP